MKPFPASPFANHEFIENPADGSLAVHLSPLDWHVVLQRDGTIRGPRPVGRYPLRHLGLPRDVIALHVVDIQPQEEKDRYERMEDDILVAGNSASSTKSDNQTNENAEEKPFVRPEGAAAQDKDNSESWSEFSKPNDPFVNTLRLFGVIGSLGALAVGLVNEFTGENESQPDEPEKDRSATKAKADKPSAKPHGKPKTSTRTKA